MSDPVLTVQTLARLLKVHPTTVYKLVKSRGLPFFRIGSEYRFNAESVESWMRSLENPETAAVDSGLKR